jgi:tetratricopeptide (TPR) repeat protein
LIRLAKWNDHKGDLSTAIRLMETAKEKAGASKNKDLLLWSYTNLADYYGHAGKIQESYGYYLLALSLDPNSAYAKKGIAWIVYSYEKNPIEAMRILENVTKYHSAPDYYLLKAELAQYLKDDRNYRYHLDSYFKLAKNPQYGTMYNIPNTAFYLDRTGQHKKALTLARKEVDNRATPETYALLAYAYFRAGKINRAVEIADKQVFRKTFEPKSLLYTAEIYKAAGKTEDLAVLRAELMGAAYELGPLRELRIKEL